MSEPSKKIVLPAYLIRRLEAYRIAMGWDKPIAERPLPERLRHLARDLELGTWRPDSGKLLMEAAAALEGATS